MRVGINCFKDKQIRSMIESFKKSGDCEILKDKQCLIYNTEEDDYLTESLDSILDVFCIASDLGVSEDNEKVDYLANFLIKWGIFNQGILNMNQVNGILKEICKDTSKYDERIFQEKVTVYEYHDSDSLSRQCLLFNSTWNNFCHEIKHVNRFHNNKINLTQLETLLGNLNKTFKVQDNKLTLYRARICDGATYEIGYQKKDMGVPPAKDATAGRINSEGIQCLYLASNINTVIHEVRARDNDHITVGTFTQKRDLNLVDFSIISDLSPLSDVDILWYAINIDIIVEMANEISKPMRRFDKKTDYLPTQYICDYIKHKGYDGIIYKSSLVENGLNYAIFNSKNFECNSVKLFNVKKMDYEIERFEER